jgi:hypothetical protein
MGIRVVCPHGHVFKVKDKYAGKKGLCPHCEGQVIVQVPDVLSSQEVKHAYEQAWSQEHDTGHGSSIFDDLPHEQDAGTSGSLLGSSVIRHHVRCAFCREPVPMWYAKCPKCGHFLETT